MYHTQQLHHWHGTTTGARGKALLKIGQAGAIHTQASTGNTKGITFLLLFITRVVPAASVVKSAMVEEIPTCTYPNQVGILDGVGGPWVLVRWDFGLPYFSLILTLPFSRSTIKCPYYFRTYEIMILGR